MNSPNSFVSLAEKYCTWSKLGCRNPDDDYRTAIRLLPAIYIAAIDLPEYTADDIDAPSCSDDEWRSVYDRFRTMPIGLYPVILDYASDSDLSIGQGDLLDDLADLYRDLVGPLLLYNAGHSNAAFWHWKWGFQYHWGDHLISAIYILHRFRRDNQA